MDGLVVILLLILSGVVFYLVLSQGRFQRVDYSSLIDQEENEQRGKARQAHLERMIAEQAASFERGRQELERMIARAQEQINGQGNEPPACSVGRDSVPAIGRPAILP
ncbi:hypothetical protein IIA79_05965, partial [bacterium]|nr:hypothetical protein [bacterium]